MEFFLEPLQYEFMQRGLVCGIVVGILSALMGSFAISRRTHLLGNTIQYSVFLIWAVLYLYKDGGSRDFQIPAGIFLVFAIIQGKTGNLIEIKEEYISVAILIAAVSSFAFLADDLMLIALLGIVYGINLGFKYLLNKKIIEKNIASQILLASALPLGVALISTARSYAVDLVHIFFGDALGISFTNMGIVLGIGLSISVIMLFLYRPLVIIFFDPQLATKMRLPTEILNELMFLFLGLTVVTLLQYVGVGLVILMILTPASVAYILTHRFASMIWVSVLVGVFSSIMGLYLSYYLSIASGSASVLTASAIFCVVIVLKGGKIVLSDWIKEFKMKK